MDCFREPQETEGEIKNKKIDERIALTKALYRATHRLLLVGLFKPRV